MKVKLVLSILILWMFASFSSCNSYHRKQQKSVKEAQKRKEAAEKEREKKYEEAVKRHASIQSKRTRTTMKNTYSKAESYNLNQKPTFYKRWFKSKKKTIKAPSKEE